MLTLFELDRASGTTITAGADGVATGQTVEPAPKVATGQTVEPAPKVATGARVTASERAARVRELHQHLAEAVESLPNSEQWSRYLRLVAQFRTYSASNIMLILAQCPDASRIASFRKWRELGRKVRKGSKAIRIRGFAEVVIGEELADPGTPRNRAGEPVRRVFPPVSVFDISQTDSTPQWDDQQISAPPRGDGGAHLESRFVAYAESLGYTVSTGKLRDGVNGCANGRSKTITLGDHLEPAGRVAVLLHEIAHVKLGHADLPVGEYVATRDRCEVEAESVAWITGTMQGLDMSGKSPGYVFSWAENKPELLRDTAERVTNVARELSAALDD